MLAVSNYFLKQKDSFNISVFIYYNFKWFSAFNKKEMSYEKCVLRIMQKNSNSTCCDKCINNNNNNNKFMEQFRAGKIYMFIIEY